MTYVPRYEPRFASDEEATAAYMACGRLAISWGPLEAALEGIIMRLRNLQRVPTGTNNGWKDFPTSFSRKKDEAKDRLKVEPELAHLHADLVPLLAEASKLHDLRGIVVHGICHGSVFGKAKLLFHVPDFKNGYTSRSKSLSLDAINDASARISDIQVSLSRILGEVPISRAHM